MTYEEALTFWFGRVNYEQRSPHPSDLKLDRMRALLRLLSDPQERLQIVHVAGSKGKGSISAMIAAILRQAGYRTGLFTSPHLSSVEERIQINGLPITAAELTALLDDVRPAVEALDHHTASDPREVPPTFFEIATALGFLHFVRRRVDVAVVEVGLGGRFDSTNVCRPRLAVISSISLDHTQQLGNRLASIAMEKAGIIKPVRPAVSGATAPEARQVIEAICRERRSPLQQLGVDFRYTYQPGQVLSPTRVLPPRVQVVTRRRAWPAMELGLLGEHQAANAAVAVACVEQLRAEGFSIRDDAVASGLAGVYWPARMEVLGRGPLVVLDCAHNVASIQALIDTLQTSFPPVPRAGGNIRGNPRRLLIFASSSDKDIPGMLRLLAPHFAHLFLTRFANSPRSVQPERLAEILHQIAAVRCTVCATAADAWQAAGAAAGVEDLICVTGSVFLAGELRPLLLQAVGSGPPCSPL